MNIHQLILCLTVGAASLCAAQTTGVQCVAEQVLYQQVDVDGATGPIESAGSLLAYTTGQDTLSIYDASDPSNPVLISATPGLVVNDAFGNGFTMNDSVVATSRFNEIRLIDISDPANPAIATPIATQGFDEIWMTGLQLIVYTGSSYEVYDISDPYSPTLEGSISISFDPYGTAVNATTLCVTEEGVGLHLFEISDPSNISEVGFYANDHLRPGAIAKDDLLVLMQGTPNGNRAFFVDIADPTSPIEIPNNGDEIKQLADAEFVNDYLVVSRNFFDQYLDIFDISNPGMAQRYRTISGPEIQYLKKFSAIGSDLAVISVGGLQIFPLTDPGPITSVIYNDTPIGIASDASLMGMFVDGQFAYTVDTTNSKLHVLDLSNPTAPQVLSTLDVGNFSFFFPARPIAYADQVVYLSNDSLQIQAVDVSDPMSPTLITTFDGWDPNVGQTGLTASLDAADGYLYVNPDFGPLVIFDVHDPANPVMVYSLGASDLNTNEGVAVSGSRLVSFSRFEGGGSNYSYFRVFDITDPTQPVELNRQPGTFNGLPGDYKGGYAFGGDTLLISFGNRNGSGNGYIGGMMSFDIASDIEMLDEISFEPFADSFVDGAGIGQILIDGDIAYAPQGYGYWGVAVFDISDPSNILYKGTSGASEYIGAAYATLDGPEIYGVGANLVGVVDASTDCVGSCPADLTGDGYLDFFDASAFLIAYNTQDPAADFTNDGIWDFFDVSAFLTAYNAGCP
ncbi:MAG: GC-type dockerin domain-anchored protein [Phycisphaerales bacterium]